MFGIRKDASVVFPSNLQKTLSNLVLFVLKHSSSSTKFRTSLEICSHRCIQANLNTTSRKLHELTTAIQLVQRQLENTKSIESQQVSPNDVTLADRVSLLLRVAVLQQVNLQLLHTSLSSIDSFSVDENVTTILKGNKRHLSAFKEILQQYTTRLNSSRKK